MMRVRPDQSHHRPGKGRSHDADDPDDEAGDRQAFATKPAVGGGDPSEGHDGEDDRQDGADAAEPHDRQHQGGNGQTAVPGRSQIGLEASRRVRGTRPEAARREGCLEEARREGCREARREGCREEARQEGCREARREPRLEALRTRVRGLSSASLLPLVGGLPPAAVSSAPRNSDAAPARTTSHPMPATSPLPAEFHSCARA